MSTAINLSKLPAPKIIENLSFEAILMEMKEEFKKRYPKHEHLDLESDPVVKLLEVAAYRELLLRARINAATKGVMLAFAQDSDLDHLGALFNVKRQVVKKADPDAFPPTEAVMEEDARFRRRIQLALEGVSTAGATSSYRFHALGSSGKIKDVHVYSDNPGEVNVAVLAHDGVPSQELLDMVSEAVNAEDVRPLTDKLLVHSAKPIEYEIDAGLELNEGPDTTVVLATARKLVEQFAEEQGRIGIPVTIDGLHKALRVEGVRKVHLHKPTADINTLLDSYPVATSIQVKQI